MTEGKEGTEGRFDEVTQLVISYFKAFYNHKFHSSSSVELRRAGNSIVLLPFSRI